MSLTVVFNISLTRETNAVTSNKCDIVDCDTADKALITTSHRLFEPLNPSSNPRCMCLLAP